eukprot:TRINITY_DN9707_c0_g4_i1.p4 TRINITY_DN9707_c0_g4~~TRINITY_DN9707_c0_g4_i1.p4  ORF type:complete len:161 (+),score=2.23 TRINITY_DN9707_c0_g4_i1:691-1173(+)
MSYKLYIYKDRVNLGVLEFIYIKRINVIMFGQFHKTNKQAMHFLTFLALDQLFKLRGFYIRLHAFYVILIVIKVIIQWSTLGGGLIKVIIEWLMSMLSVQLLQLRKTFKKAQEVNSLIFQNILYLLNFVGCKKSICTTDVFVKFLGRRYFKSKIFAKVKF